MLCFSNRKGREAGIVISVVLTLIANLAKMHVFRVVAAVRRSTNVLFAQSRQRVSLTMARYGNIGS
jgi:hypothetical protein